MDIRTKFLGLSGQICTLTYTRPLKTKTNVDKEVVKTTTLQCRAGVSYDNIGVVQEKRESGEYPEENQGLPWGKWKEYPFIIEHNNEEYFRFYTLKNQYIPQVTYFVNGVVTSKEDALALLPKQYEQKTELFNVNSKYISELK